MDAIAITLLEEKNKLQEKIQHYSSVEASVLVKALNAVLERHTHVTTGHKMRGKSGLSKRCTECGFAYPCPTIQAVTNNLP